MKQPKRVDDKILKLIADRAGVTERRAYQMIEQAERQYVISRRTAANFVAWKYGANVQKFKSLTQRDLNELRSLIAKAQSSTTAEARQGLGRTSPEAAKAQRSKKNIDTLILPSRRRNEVDRMSEVYSHIYVLENSIRHLIRSTLEKKYGSDWWGKATITVDIRNDVKDRQQLEEKERWHAKRGAHQIYYTDFSDLVSIIINNWEEFKKLVPKQHRLRTKLEEIELSRNIVAHSNPLPNREVERLKLNFEDWKRILSPIGL